MKIRGKTFDGIKLTDIIRMLDEVGANVRQGSKHKLVATSQYTPFSCAIGPTTCFKKHIIPWMHKAFPDYSNQEIYQMIGKRY